MATEAEFLFPNLIVAGVDEVGRGPLIGDVVTAAVILDPSRPIEGLADSKKLTDKKRQALYQLIMDNALAISIGRASPAEIDEINILNATMLAMQRAVFGLHITPQHVLIDGNRCPQLAMSAQAVVKGDARVDEISAASIIAKVTRDGEMAALDRQYPQFGLAKHKGYPTKLHLDMIEQHGVTPYHRKSFKPVAAALNNS